MVTLTPGCGFPKEARSQMDIYGIAQRYYANMQLDVPEIPHEAAAIRVRGDEC
jgi:hypothetical protein